MNPETKKAILSNCVIAKIIHLWPYHMLQSIFSAVALLLIILLIGDINKMVAISAMGASCFIVFAMPKAVSAQTRNVVGGHFTGLICGLIFYFFIPLPYWIEYPLAVGIAIFIMVSLDLEHPPAVGTALAVLRSEVDLQVFAIIILSIMILSQIRYYFRKYLKDLV